MPTESRRPLKVTSASSKREWVSFQPAAERRKCWFGRSKDCGARDRLAAGRAGVFETIGFAKVSTSAEDARRLGF